MAGEIKLLLSRVAPSEDSLIAQWMFEEHSGWKRVALPNALAIAANPSLDFANLSSTAANILARDTITVAIRPGMVAGTPIPYSLLAVSIGFAGHHPVKEFRLTNGNSKRGQDAAMTCARADNDHAYNQSPTCNVHRFLQIDRQFAVPL